jgi:hypothetical protein
MAPNRYHGRDPGTWAGVAPTDVLKVPGSSMEARFHSDSSNNDWGYKFTVSFFSKVSNPISPFYKVISPVLSCLPLSLFARRGLNPQAPLPDSLYKTFAMYLKALATQADTNIDGLFRSNERDATLDYLSTLLMMKSFGHCDAACAMLLFKKIYLLAIVAKEELILPPPSASKDMICEIGSVFAQHLTDSKLRTMIEQTFVKAAAISASAPSFSTTFFAVLAAAIECSSRSSNNQDPSKKSAVSKCPNDHVMTLCSSIPLAMMRLSRGWTCNQCSKVIPLFQTGVWYCETCS